MLGDSHSLSLTIGTWEESGFKYIDSKEYDFLSEKSHTAAVAGEYKEKGAARAGAAEGERMLEIDTEQTFSDVVEDYKKHIEKKRLAKEQEKNGSFTKIAEIKVEINELDPSEENFSGELKKKVDSLNKETGNFRKFKQELASLESFKQYFQGSLPEKSIFDENYQDKKFAGERIGPQVKRFGIDVVKHFFLAEVETSGQLHPVELFSIFKSLEYLKTVPAADTEIKEKYKMNVAICDIFAREGTKIKKSDSNFPVVHSIALWKVSEDTAMVLDPNDYNFSKIIFDAKMGVGLIEPYVIKGEKEKRFYTRAGVKEGRERLQARDCIDIAVKIGFEINEIERRLTDPKKIYEELCDRMSTTTGNIGILKVNREAHSSSLKIREIFFESYRKIEENFPNAIGKKISTALKK